MKYVLIEGEKVQVPLCFDNPEAEYGGECTYAQCMHHCKTEPVCCSANGLENRE